MAKYRKQAQGGGLFSAMEHQQAVVRREVGILKLRDVIDREKASAGCSKSSVATISATGGV